MKEHEIFGNWYTSADKEAACEVCEQHRELRLVVNPYIFLTSGERIPGWFCWECYRQLTRSVPGA